MRVGPVKKDENGLWVAFVDDKWEPIEPINAAIISALLSLDQKVNELLKK